MAFNLLASTSTDYTVAWISTLRREHSILCAALDNIYPVPDNTNAADNHYTFGLVGQHKVVVACLALEGIGTASTAALVAGLARSFPNIQFVLSIGAAQTTPKEGVDIRLGDLVVNFSSNDEASHGIPNHQPSSRVQASDLVAKRRNAVLPDSLIQAVKDIQGSWKHEGPRLELEIKMMFEQTVPVPERYQQLLKENDELHVSSYTRLAHYESCDSTNAPDASHRTNSPEELHSRESLMVHYGTLDAKDQDFVCFDTNSGQPFTGDVQFAIVRGISGYSDSHKQFDLWHSYAAVTATIYARKILDTISPATNLSIGTSNTKDGTSIDSRAILKVLSFEGIRAKIDSSQEEVWEFHDWIWDTTFPEWLSRSDETFWILGNRGSGKSCLMKYLARSKRTLACLQSRDPSFHITLFSFDRRARFGLANSICGMYRTILYQLAEQSEQAAKQLTSLFSTGKLRLNSEQLLLFALCSALDASGKKLCVFVDGLDDYDGGILELINVFRLVNDRAPVKFCLACRPERPATSDAKPSCSIKVHEENKVSMRAYAERRFTYHKDKVQPSILHLLDCSYIENLVKVADGFFLWFRLAIDEISDRLDAGTLNSHAIGLVSTMTFGLEYLYLDLLSSISSNHVEEAALILYLATNLQAMSGWTEKGISVMMDFTTADLDHLWGTYDFIVNHLAPEIATTPARTFHQLRSRIDKRFHGLIEFSPLTRLSTMLDLRGVTDTNIRFVHESFVTFLRKTEWIDEHLPWSIKQHFKKGFWLTLSANIIDQAAKESVIRPEIMERATQELKTILSPSMGGILGGVVHWASVVAKQPFSVLAALHNQFCPLVGGIWFMRLCGLWAPDVTFPPCWQSRHVVLRTALFIFLHSAASYESCGLSSFPVIHCTLQSYLSPIIGYCMLMSDGDFLLDREIGEVFADDQLRPVRDIYLALIGQLPLYFRDRMSGSSLTLYQQEIFYRVILSNLDIEKDTSIPTIESMLATMAKCGRLPQTKDACYLLSTTDCWQNASAYAAALIPQATTKVDKSQKSRFCCAGKGWKLGTLFHWARLTCAFDCRCGSVCGESMSDCRKVIDLLMILGADINQPCYPGGTALHVILDNSVQPRQGHKHLHRETKFLIMIEKGFTPGAVLDREELLLTAISLYRTEEISASEKSEIDLIISYLRFYSINEKWPKDRFDAAEMRQSAVDRWPNSTPTSVKPEATRTSSDAELNRGHKFSKTTMKKSTEGEVSGQSSASRSDKYDKSSTVRRGFQKSEKPEDALSDINSPEQSSSIVPREGSRTPPGWVRTAITDPKGKQREFIKK